jgi:hypothetical protein
MPVIAVVGDQCVGNNIAGFVISGSPTSKVYGSLPMARVTDKVLIIGISPIPPGGEIISVPIGFCPSPCLWFYIEIGIIVASPVVTIDVTLPVAATGATWVSPHFFGTIQAALAAPNVVF